MDWNESAQSADRPSGVGLSKSVSVGTRKMVNYAWIGWSQRKLWWRSVAVLTCKSFVKFGYRGERLEWLGLEKFSLMNLVARIFLIGKISISIHIIIKKYHSLTPSHPPRRAGGLSKERGEECDERVYVTEQFRGVEMPFGAIPVKSEFSRNVRFFSSKRRAATLSNCRGSPL